MKTATADVYGCLTCPEFQYRISPLRTYRAKSTKEEPALEGFAVVDS